MHFSPDGDGPKTLFYIIDFSLQGVLPVEAEENRGNLVFPGLRIESNGELLLTSLRPHGNSG